MSRLMIYRSRSISGGVRCGNGVDKMSMYRTCLRRSFRATGLAVILVALAVPSSEAITPLPDGRAYEQVSVPKKAGYSVGGEATAAAEVGVDPSGDRILFESFFALPPAQNPSSAAFQVNRTKSGWDTNGVFPPPGPNQSGLGIPATSQNLMLATPDQQTTVIWDNTTPPYGGLSIRRADGSLQKIVDGAAFGSPWGQSANQAWAAGISDDGKRVIFASSQRLIEGLPAGSYNILYEWIDDGGEGTLRVVNRTNSEALELVAAASADLGGSTSNQGTRVLGGVRGRRHAISDGSDGHSRIFFQSPAPTTDTATAAGPVYVREDGERTIDISAPEGSNSAASQRRFLDATPDGRHAYFWANAKLTDDGLAGGAIYRYDVGESGQPGDLVFVDTAPPISSAPPTALVSDNGRTLLYQRGSEIVIDDRGAKHVVLQGTIGAGTFTTSGVHKLPTGITGTTGIRDDRCPSASTTSDGRFVTFTTGSPNRLYRYDVDKAKLIEIASSGVLFIGICNTNQAPRPVQNRLISDDGKRIFFDTIRQLLPGDSNLRIDVYEWFDDGSEEGRLSLVSGGSGPRDSGFMGMDRYGESAFFVTADRLVPQDGDDANDIYVARVGGGFPYQQSLPSCDGDTCQGPPSSKPALPNIGSLSFVDDGNVPPEPMGHSSGPWKVKVVPGITPKLRVRVPEGGKIVAQGRQVRRSVKRFRTGGVIRLDIRLKPPSLQRLRNGARLNVTLRVTYKPKDGRPASRNLKVMLESKSKLAKARKGGR